MSTQAKIKIRFRIALDKLTGRKRARPNFIVIGTEKGGTTSLYAYLSRHPQIIPPLTKEPHYFSLYYNQGARTPDWYKAQFPLMREMEMCARQNHHSCQTFEASSSYISYARSARRIHEAMPNVKLVALLRNPVNRAYSQYNHQVRAGSETLSFEDAIDQEDVRLQGEIERLKQDDNYYSAAHHRHGYLHRSIYIEEIKPWVELFPPENLLIVRSEDFYKDTQRIYSQILGFLGLESLELEATQRINAGKYDPMKPETRARLVEYFSPYNQQLYAYLNRDFEWDN